MDVLEYLLSPPWSIRLGFRADEEQAAAPWWARAEGNSQELTAFGESLSAAIEGVVGLLALEWLSTSLGTLGLPVHDRGFEGGPYLITEDGIGGRVALWIRTSAQTDRIQQRALRDAFPTARLAGLAPASVRDLQEYRSRPTV